MQYNTQQKRMPLPEYGCVYFHAAGVDHRTKQSVLGQVVIQQHRNSQYFQRRNTDQWDVTSVTNSFRHRQSAVISLATDELLTEVDCLTNLTDNTVVASLATILDKANKQNIPVFGSEIEQVKIGCLAAEGLDYVALGKQTGKMAAEILKGEKKAPEMNFETITEPGFYVNEKVAENLGVTVPQDLADEAVESFTEITK